MDQKSKTKNKTDIIKLGWNNTIYFSAFWWTRM